QPLSRRSRRDARLCSRTNESSQEEVTQEISTPISIDISVQRMTGNRCMPRALWQKFTSKHDYFFSGEGLRPKIRSDMSCRKIIRALRLSNSRNGQMRMIGARVTY